jgi:predicted N-acyltransferase
MTQVDPMVAPRALDAANSRHQDYIDTGWIEIEGEFDDFWRARGKNLRQNMRKQRARLAADGVQLTLEALRDRSEMALV